MLYLYLLQQVMEKYRMIIIMGGYSCFRTWKEAAFLQKDDLYKILFCPYLKNIPDSQKENLPNPWPDLI